jgi:hypothetical protein
LTVDAPTPTAVVIARAGQNARYSFAGTVGQSVTVVLTGNALDDGNASTVNSTQVLVFKPSNSVSAIALNSISTGAAGATVDVTLPETGTYTIAIKPTGLDSGSINAQVKAFASGALALDSSTAVNLTSGQNARFSFTGQAGTGYGLALTNLVLTPSTGSPTPTVTATLRKADGTSLTSCSFGSSSSCDFDPASFATTGTYLLDLDPNGLVAASFNAVLSTDASGTLTVDAPAPTVVAIARAGQNARYSFAGTAGQSVTVVFTGNALDDGNAGTVNSTQVLMFKPSNSVSPIANNSMSTGAAGVTVDVTLPETGTYTLAIKPTGLDSGSINVQVKAFASGALALDGSTAINLGAGQNARFIFTGQAGTG